MFYESYDNLNENAYGFSQFHKTYVFEEKLIVAKSLPSTAWWPPCNCHPAALHEL